MYLSYLPCIKKFDLPPSASCPVNRNVNDEERLPLVSVSIGVNISFFFFFKFRMTFTLTKYLGKSQGKHYHSITQNPFGTYRHPGMEPATHCLELTTSPSTLIDGKVVAPKQTISEPKKMIL